MTPTQTGSVGALEFHPDSLAYSTQPPQQYSSTFFLFLFPCVLQEIPIWHIPAILLPHSPQSVYCCRDLRLPPVSPIFPYPLFPCVTGLHIISLSDAYFRISLRSMWHMSRQLPPVIRPWPFHHFSKYPPSSSGIRILGQSNACQLYVQVSAFHVSALSMIVATLRIRLQQGDIQIGMGGGYVQIG